MIPVLMIALEFAPIQTTGAFRSIDFARYLPEQGFRPHVLTIEPEAGARMFGAPRNAALLEGLPAAVSLDYLEPPKSSPDTRFRRFLRIYGTFNDTFYSRLQSSLRSKLSALRAREPFKVVYVSAPPFGAAQLGELAASILGVPLVVDMRDAWSEWGMAPNPTYLHYMAKKHDERRAFRNAAAVVTVTERLADVFRKSHPSVSPTKFEVIHNGFNGPEFERSSLGIDLGKKTFDIVYVGSFYYQPASKRSAFRPQRYLNYRRGIEDWSYRSPLYFLRAWKKLADIAPHTAACIRFHYIGNAPDWLAPMIDEHGFARLSKLWGMVPKQEVGAILASMDAQLATSMKRPDGGDYCLASKTFDYFVARKPILAFVTEGSQKDFLLAGGASVFCEPDDPSGSAAAIKSLMEGKSRLQINGDFLNSFHRRKQTQRLASILTKVIAG